MTTALQPLFWPPVVLLMLAALVAAQRLAVRRRPHGPDPGRPPAPLPSQPVPARDRARDLLGVLPRARPCHGHEIRRGLAWSHGRGHLPGLAGLLYRPHRFLPAQPERPSAVRPRRRLLQRRSHRCRRGRLPGHRLRSSGGLHGRVTGHGHVPVPALHSARRLLHHERSGRSAEPLRLPRARAEEHVPTSRPGDQRQTEPAEAAGEAGDQDLVDRHRSPSWPSTSGASPSWHRSSSRRSGRQSTFRAKPWWRRSPGRTLPLASTISSI